MHTTYLCSLHSRGLQSNFTSPKMASRTTTQDLEQAAIYTQLPDHPHSPPDHPRTFKGLAGIFLSLILTSTLVALVLNHYSHPNVNVNQPETLMPSSRGVEQGESEKAVREFSGTVPVYPWTNAMLAWQRTSYYFQPEKNWMNGEQVRDITGEALEPPPAKYYILSAYLETGLDVQQWTEMFVVRAFQKEKKDGHPLQFIPSGNTQAQVVNVSDVIKIQFCKIVGVRKGLKWGFMTNSKYTLYLTPKVKVKPNDHTTFKIIKASGNSTFYKIVSTKDDIGEIGWGDDWGRLGKRGKSDDKELIVKFKKAN